MTEKTQTPGTRWLWPVRILAIFLLGQAVYAQNGTNAEGWRLLSRYLYADAAAEFSGDDSASKLGLAASLLNKPPVTPGKIEQAEELLREVIGRDDSTGGAQYARYLLVRIAHLHREAEVPEIEAGYREVLAMNTNSPVAQVAASHLSLVLLYQRPDLSVEARLMAAAELVPVATLAHLPEVAVSYYRTLAGAAMYYDIVDRRVLAWLEEARATRSADELIRIGVSLQLAEVSRILGLREKAVGYYREFIAEAVPTDQRVNTAKLRMRELEEQR